MQANRLHPLVDQAGVLPRAHVMFVIDPAREGLVFDRTSTPLEPSKKADLLAPAPWPTRIALRYLAAINDAERFSTRMPASLAARTKAFRAIVELMTPSIAKAHAFLA